MSDTENYMVIKVENDLPVGYPITYSNLKLLYPTEVFSLVPINKQLNFLGYNTFYIEEKPVVFQTHVEQDGYILNEQNGAWTYKWKLTPFTEEEIQIEEQKETEKKWFEMRMTRNEKLFMTDWTQLSDAPLTVEQKRLWADYRQLLRDFPSTVTDIDNLVWPTKP